MHYKHRHEDNRRYHVCFKILVEEKLLSAPISNTVMAVLDIGTDSGIVKLFDIARVLVLLTHISCCGGLSNLLGHIQL
jgi:hypothetical protein